MRKLLVGYDGTESAKRALGRAAEMVANGDTLGVISVAPVIPGGPRSGGPFSAGDGPDEHRAEITEAVEFLRGHGIQPNTIVAAGDPAKAICEAAGACCQLEAPAGLDDGAVMRRQIGGAHALRPARDARQHEHRYLVEMRREMP